MIAEVWCICQSIRNRNSDNNIFVAILAVYKVTQGTLREREGSVQLTFSLMKLIWYKSN